MKSKIVAVAAVVITMFVLTLTASAQGIYNNGYGYNHSYQYSTDYRFYRAHSFRHQGHQYSFPYCLNGRYEEMCRSGYNYPGFGYWSRERWLRASTIINAVGEAAGQALGGVAQIMSVRNQGRAIDAQHDIDQQRVQAEVAIQQNHDNAQVEIAQIHAEGQVATAVAQNGRPVTITRYRDAQGQQVSIVPAPPGMFVQR